MVHSTNFALIGFMLAILCVFSVFCSVDGQQEASAIAAMENIAATATTDVILATSTAVESTTHKTDERKKYLLATDVPTCQQRNANLSACVQKLFEIMLPRLKDGDKELNIPPLDPFRLNRTTFQYTNGVIYGRIALRGAQIFGFSKIQHKSLHLNVESGKTKYRALLHVPQLRITGSYKGDFLLNNVQLRPKGTFNVTLIDVDLDQSAEGVLYEKDMHRFVRLVKFDTNPKIRDLKIAANGIFAEPALNELFVNVANQYWREFYRVMLPETRRYWEPLLVRVANEALASVPFDEFIKD